MAGIYVHATHEPVPDVCVQEQKHNGVWAVDIKTSKDDVVLFLTTRDDVVAFARAILEKAGE